MPNILIITDDVRFPSGVANQARLIIKETNKHSNDFRWVNIGGAVQNPDAGKRLLAGNAFDMKGNNDLVLYPMVGYGSWELQRAIIREENVDAVMLFTDPRQFQDNVFAHDMELRTKIPLMFYTIWDDVPAPVYNRSFYESCDWLGSISKQTYGLVNMVCPNRTAQNHMYLPHGVEHNMFKPLPEDDAALIEKRKELFGEDDVDFVMLYVNRNARRKHTADCLLAWKKFTDFMTPEQRAKARFILRTEPVDVNGTNLLAIQNDMNIPGVIFVPEMTRDKMPLLYNISDVTINIADNEGFGLGTLESMMCGTPILVNITGGLQDQVGLLNPVSPTSHHVKQATGSWVYPVWPAARALQGSLQTPYIAADYVDWQDVVEQLIHVYKTPKAERKSRGLVGREWAISQGFTAEAMGAAFVNAINATIANFKPIKPWEIVGGSLGPKHAAVHVDLEYSPEKKTELEQLWNNN
jgi:glycosyltransferase involved in cell wall biosynthesis